MTKYKPYSRREFQRRLRGWIRKNLSMIAGLTAGLVGLILLESFLLLMLPTPTAFKWWLVGVSQAVLVAAYLHLLHATFLANDREAIWHLRGAWGEDNTRSELQRAKRKRLIWGWVDSITLREGDIDHLVITRSGGLVAIDTKWRNQADDTIHMAKAAHRARLRAEGLAKTLLTREYRARHRARTSALKVTPAVVLWGAAQRDVPDDAHVEGIEFIPGRRLIGWLKRLDDQPVSKAAADDLINHLQDFRANAWETSGR